MFSQIENYYPPVGTYDVSYPASSRCVDFSKTPSRDTRITQEPIKHQPRYIPLASPQLHNYAHPSQRVRMRKQSYHNRPDPLAQTNLGIKFSETPRKRQKGKLQKVNHEKVMTEEKIIKPIRGFSILETTQEKITFTPSKKRKKSINVHNIVNRIFNLFPAESLEMAYLKERMNKVPVPSPGHYSEQISKQVTVQWRFQCFQTSEKRFKTDQLSSAPVGNYNIDVRPRIGSIQFDKYAPRKARTNSNPGVGTYTMATSLDRKEIAKYVPNFPKSFGTSSKRF